MINLEKIQFQMIDDDTDFIPLMTPEDEDLIYKEDLPEKLSILPLRNTVLFPGVIIPITAGRDKSIKLINDANAGDKIIGVVSQKDSTVEDPSSNDLNKIGTIAKIIKVFKIPNGGITVILQGKKRFIVDKFLDKEPYITAKISNLEEKRDYSKDEEFEAIVEGLKDLAIKIIKEDPNIPSDATFAIKNIESTSFLINFISSNMNMDASNKQSLLEINDLKKRALQALKHLTSELQRLELKNDIQSKVKTDIDQQQREYYLQQQMRTIQEELGGVSYEEEIDEMRKKSKTKKWTKEISEIFDKELGKLQRMNPQVAEYSIQRNYLDLILDLPWGKYSKDNFDLKNTTEILDKDHYGLKKVKERIIEHLAVLKIKGDMKSPIICLYGPPGVGKTSLGRSIAKSLNRKYIRISLGGLRDEAEIRGHRKTYIGAMPGRIIQSLKKAGTSNPVFVLDEIDKLSSSYNGDPSSAMLEVLDPEQNSEFHDNFLEMGYDLSKVLFIATANNIGDIQPALRDRMEMIDISGYTIEEKVEIAKHHLFHKQMKNHGLKLKDLKISKNQFEKIVDGYTRESGVRGLDKNIAKIVRNTAKHIALEEEYDVKLSDERLVKILGVSHMERDKYQGNDVAGVVTGLAWTSVGGDILFIESILSPGNGTLTMTGNLGKVMQESAKIALEYIKSNAEEFGIKPEILKKWNVHIHVPEGATPKDGPSAGITMLTSLVSVYTQRKVKDKLAMTGEITLRGKVLPVGGIKEKILAAKRANITQLILCKENEKDINEIEDLYLKGLTFHYVTNMIDVIDLAISKEFVAKPKDLTIKEKKDENKKD